ncbi:MAG TPA: 3-phosphoshikimate 1-carboxyvinyltransferase [Candidatus Dormibacteraeota bacterium]|nr:3-phosphoshikimate 1-carboxyvinyltransferase [Candidatus Dormibacteraeota bacterium]
MIATVRRAKQLQGEIVLPGDKSISHRALILGAIAGGGSTIRGLSRGADVGSTAACLRALGVEIGDGEVAGVGMSGLRAPSGPLDCGNSGTTMRLLAGLLAAQDFESELTGDDSLKRRPMDRVVEPLRQMGARAEWPPLRIGGSAGLHGIEYRSPVASAQVKSALLLAGLFAEGATEVVEPSPTRDHTERMLRAMGAEVTVNAGRSRVERTKKLEPLDLDVPGDLSAASFWLVAAGLVPGSRVRMAGVGLNPTRTAFLELLRRAGFAISIAAAGEAGGEPIGTVEVGGAGELRPLTVEGPTAAAMIDELPVLAVAATQLPGTSRISGARELRVKESDRIAAMAEALTAMGADITATEDGWIINGPRHLEGARVDSLGDHRVAMAMAVAGMIADGDTTVDDAACVDISYPGFFDQLDSLRRAAG